MWRNTPAMTKIQDRCALMLIRLANRDEPGTIWHNLAQFAHLAAIDKMAAIEGRSGPTILYYMCLCDTSFADI